MDQTGIASIGSTFCDIMHIRLAAGNDVLTLGFPWKVGKLNKNGNTTNYLGLDYSS